MQSNPKQEHQEGLIQVPLYSPTISFRVPEAALIDATAARSAEAHSAAGMSRSESEEFRVNIPPAAYTTISVEPFAIRQAVSFFSPSVPLSSPVEVRKEEDGDFYGKIIGTVSKVASTVWGGIEILSEGVADFFGVTSPRYELWMEDSITYQKEIASQNLQQEATNAAVLQGMNQQSSNNNRRSIEIQMH